METSRGCGRHFFCNRSADEEETNSNGEKKQQNSQPVEFANNQIKAHTVVASTGVGMSRESMDQSQKRLV